MKYCGRYSNNINMSNFDEIAIQYDNQMEELVQFLKEYGDKKITLVISNIQNFYNRQTWNTVNSIHEAYPDINLSVCFYEIGTFESLSEVDKACMRELTVPYYCGYVATNFEQLHHLCEAGAKEVYLAEDICFDFKRARRVCDNYGAAIRVFPNVAQSSVKTSAPHKKFFIRPEDVEAYSDVIDTLEFWGELDRQEIFLRIYKSGTWKWDLTAIIAGLNIDFNSAGIIPLFAESRKNCRKKCLTGEVCTICDTVLGISKKLSEDQFVIKYKKSN